MKYRYCCGSSGLAGASGRSADRLLEQFVYLVQANARQVSVLVPNQHGEMGNNVSNFFTPEFNNESAIAPWNASLEPTKAIIPQLDANRVLTGGIGQEVNIPTLTPEAYDNIILPDASLTRMASAVSTESNSSLPDNSVDLLTGQAMSEVYGDLSKFAAQPDFATKLNVAFGENWDAAAAKALAEEWFNGDFSDIPQVKVVSSAEIGGANGAFAAATDTIYLSKEFLTGNAANPAAIADVLLEEIGHSVDARLNVTDSPGDEGAIFSRVVQDKELTQGELQGLKSEDDTATVLLDGHQYLIEKQLSSFPIQGSIGSFYNRNPAIASQLGKATGAEFQFVSSKWRQNFQNGAIFHSANGTFSVRGSLGRHYLSLGGQNSQLGLPTSEESHIGNGNWRQSFEKGTLEWLNNGTARVTLTPTTLPNPKVGNPDIDIQLVYPNGGFNATQRAILDKAAQNWKNIITQDKAANGILKIAITQTSRNALDGVAWGTDWAEAYQDETSNSRRDFFPGVDYDNRINFNTAVVSNSTWVNDWLLKTAMHEIGHTLGLSHEGTAFSLMADKKPKASITNTSYSKLTSLGYKFDPKASISWS